MIRAPSLDEEADNTLHRDVVTDITQLHAIHDTALKSGHSELGISRVSALVKGLDFLREKSGKLSNLHIKQDAPEFIYTPCMPQENAVLTFTFCEYLKLYSLGQDWPFMFLRSVKRQSKYCFMTTLRPMYWMCNTLTAGQRRQALGLEAFRRIVLHKKHAHQEQPFFASIVTGVHYAKYRSYIRMAYLYTNVRNLEAANYEIYSLDKPLAPQLSNPPPRTDRPYPPQDDD